MLRVRFGWLALVFAAVIPTPAAAQISFVPVYTDGAGEGFNDATLGVARKTAFEFTLTQIGGNFTQRFAGETVRVSAAFNPLGGSPGGAVLASAGPASFHTVSAANAPVTGVFYPTPLANHRQLADQNAATAEIFIQFNTDVDNATVLGNTNWYYGTDGAAGSHIDLITVAMHEIGHGLGYTGLMNSAGQYNGGGGQLAIYDHFMNTSSTGGTKLRNLASDALRAAEAIGNDLWWDGANGTAGNAGTRPKLHAPTTFSGGSSLYHLDETVHENELLSPFYSGVDQSFSLTERGMLQDMGWTIAPVPEPASVLLAASVVGAGGWAARRRIGRRAAIV